MDMSTDFSTRKGFSAANPNQPRRADHFSKQCLLSAKEGAARRHKAIRIYTNAYLTVIAAETIMIFRTAQARGPDALVPA